MVFLVGDHPETPLSITVADPERLDLGTSREPQSNSSPTGLVAGARGDEGGSDKTHGAKRIAKNPFDSYAMR
jgi:hypothetical protein